MDLVMADVFDQIAQEQQQQTPQAGQIQSTAAQPQGDVFDRVIAEQQQQAPPSSVSGEQTNDVGNKVIAPKEGESFADTMKRAADYGKAVTPGQVNAEVRTMPGKAATVLAAAPVIGAAGAAGLAAPGEVISGIRAFPGVAEAVLDHAETFAKAIADKYPTLVSAAGKMGVPTSVVGTLLYLYEHAKSAK